ncbi:MAG: tetratricopeptide repeat protein [Burkholderiaceae bacterium]|nr:tetratricopeptide repeat protein [Burkholderiaceae bacterium]
MSNQNLRLSSTSACATDLGEAVRRHQQGDFATAEALYRRVLVGAPDHFDACHMLGVLQIQRGQAAAGIDLLQRALRLRPEAPPAWFNLGLGLQQIERHTDALAAFERAAELTPANAEAQRNCGRELLELGQASRALAHLDHAIALRPQLAEAHSDRSDALRALNRHAEADDSATRAIALQPAMAEAWCNRGLARMEVGRLDAALADLARACQLMPSLANAQWNMALCLLLAGQFEAGWRQFEWRWLGPQRHAVQYADRPRWDGSQPVAGKTILLHAEQGLGDAIQFCRYAPLLAERGAHIVLQVHPPLVSLLRSLQGVDRVVSLGQETGAFDLHCPLLSLPLAFGTRLDAVPAHTPYLAPDAERVQAWKRLFPPTGMMRIGVAVSGSPTHRDDARRSIELGRFAALFEAADVFLLQPQCREADETFLRTAPAIRDLRRQLADFADTAALMQTLDLVISVDTSVAHLAGALHKPLWLLLPYAPDWRWMRGRDDSPWYPGTRLFRQEEPGNWEDVISRVIDAFGREQGSA